MKQRCDRNDSAYSIVQSKLGRSQPCCALSRPDEEWQSGICPDEERYEPATHGREDKQSHLACSGLDVHVAAQNHHFVNLESVRPIEHT
jgi:hypothetical protein